MATFVVAHGAWSAGWAWRKMRPRLRDLGHELWTPSYTGLGERAHLASPDITLDTHVDDVCGLLVMEDLRDVILVGHSYGGMVATGVADREAARIARLVYLDAFVPRDGQCTLDLHPPDIRERMVRAVLDGDGWRMPPNPLPSDTPEDDVAWMTPRRMGQPAKTGQQPIRLTGAVERLPRSYIYCLRPRPGDVFRQFADRARAEGWQYLEIDASHNPHITAPDALAEMLDGIAGPLSLEEQRQKIDQLATEHQHLVAPGVLPPHVRHLGGFEPLDEHARAPANGVGGTAADPDQLVVPGNVGARKRRPEDPSRPTTRDLDATLATAMEEPVSLEPDPVIELYKRDVDRTLLRENLKLTPEQRIQKLQDFNALTAALRDAGRRARK